MTTGVEEMVDFVTMTFRDTELRPTCKEEEEEERERERESQRRGVKICQR